MTMVFSSTLSTLSSVQLVSMARWIRSVNETWRLVRPAHGLIGGGRSGWRLQVQGLQDKGKKSGSRPDANVGSPNQVCSLAVGPRCRRIRQFLGSCLFPVSMAGLTRHQSTRTHSVPACERWVQAVSHPATAAHSRYPCFLCLVVVIILSAREKADLTPSVVAADLDACLDGRQQSKGCA